MAEESKKRRLSKSQIIATVVMLALLVAQYVILSMGADYAMANNEAEGVPEEYAHLETVILVGADSTSKDSAGQMFGEYVSQRLDEITGGKLVLDYHANGDLGGDADLLRQVQYNDIQVMVSQTAPTVSFVPEMAVFDLPMAFAKYDGESIDTVLNGENDFSTALEQSYERAGLHLLGLQQNATFRLTTSNKDLHQLSDFKGLQIRTMENSNHMAFWKAIGAEPTPLAWSEVYISLQNGTVDAQENAADSCVGASLQEQQKYLACTNHILYCNQICINKECYDNLDPAYQAALNQAVAEAIEYMAPKMTQIDEEGKATLVAGDMQLIEYDDAFFDEVLALDGVQALYRDIDENQADGLGSLLTAELAKQQQ